MSDDLDTFNPVRGPAREPIDAQELADPDARAAVILDRRRRRPRYFADRFLTARDLTRGQQYTLLRQADLAQLSGAGVVHGLEVHTDATGIRLMIGAGTGVARSGESIALRNEAAIPVANLRVVSGRDRATQLVAEDAASGPVTGLFMLVARPVEHSRNPGLTFAAASASQFQLADAEIVESTWFTLTPLPNAGPKDVVARGRARLAREVFVGGFDPTRLTDGLALALIGVLNGRVQWVDQALAARSVGGDAMAGFGLQPRKTRLAFQAQYARHLAEELEQRRTAGLPDGLPATEAFAVLPPVGPLPRGAVEVTPTEVRQSFFPRELYVELAIMPEDELPALLAEGLVRAPIDLEAGSSALEGVPVLIVVPVPRAGFDQRTPRMEGVYRGPALAVTGRQVVNARPIDALTALWLKNEPPKPSDPLPIDLEAWRKAVESAPQLWYVRRPQFAPTSVVVPREEPTNEEVEPTERLDAAALSRIEEADERERFNLLFGSASEETLRLANELLAEEFFDGGSPPEDELAPATETSVYISGIIGELAYMARRPRPADVANPAVLPSSPVFAEQGLRGRLRLRPLEASDILRVAARFSAPEVRTSLQGPELRSPVLRSVLATSAVVPELAVWTTAVGIGGPTVIAALASTANIAELRKLASSAAMPVPPAPPLPAPPPPAPPLPAPPLPAPPPPIDPHNVPPEEARSFPRIEKLGEVGSLYAIWNASHPEFRERLDRLLAASEQGDQPLFTTAVLMHVVTVGFDLPMESDEQGEALLRALEEARRAHEFRAPNGNEGEVLRAEAHRERDVLLELAEGISPALVAEAQKRLDTVGFAGPEREPRESLEAYRLLALASAGFEHIEAITQSKRRMVEAFAKGAFEAVERHSVLGMREALRELTLRRPI